MEPENRSSSAISPPPRSRPRRFLCEYEGCGKAFTRSEHLQRHDLNHRPSPNTCDRCRAHFARPDLLDRHKERHAQKDREAGGVGLGVLGTRKRCWRDDNGNITTKRPPASLASLPKPPTSPKSQKGKGQEEGGSGTDEAGEMSGEGASPPITLSTSLQSFSIASSARRQRDDKGRALNRAPPATIITTTEVGSFDQFQIQQLELTELDTFDNGNFQLPPPPPPQTYRLDPLLSGVPSSSIEALIANDQGLDGAFRLDSESSFARPFTELGGYTRPFGGSDSPPDVDGQSTTRFDLSQEQCEMEMNLESSFAAGTEGSRQLAAAPMSDSTFLPFDVKAPTNRLGTMSQQYHDFPGFEGLNETSAVEDESLYFVSDTRSMSHGTPSRDPQAAAATDITRHSLGSDPTHTFPASHTHHSIPVASSPIANRNHFHVCTPTSESPSPTLSTQPLPKIDEVARAKVLSLIIQATTDENGERQFGPNHSLLSISALQDYLDLFFSRFNHSYPLLHRPSFDPSNVNTLLLVSVLMLGATYGGKDAHQMAVRVHDWLRGCLGLAPEVWGRKLGTNLYESERERICRLIVMLSPNYGLCKRFC
ncbi:unnamed protein product [Tuber melanosporum]|uniref:(Perigord truffle) hypothetical protein n=1 Tax=Tuber melanosporum (strain Mel28) TaxID=656061 RepID=D5GHF4_TUBMM|nr:uncharacterized protein GSTUM_00007914001 [Tuber melanosporum]CAZ83947.1 unnamed protein product [Tuber melanosporum]